MAADFPAEWQDILSVLGGFSIRESDMVKAGGNKSEITRNLEFAFKRLGWRQVNLSTQTGSTHQIDSYKNKVALEVEWNSKDSVYDRDLDAFRTLYIENLVDVAVIVTRAASLKGVHEALSDGKSVITRKYGESTTHFGKLRPKIERGGGGGCPILVFSVSPAAIQYDITRRTAAQIPKDPRDS